MIYYVALDSGHWEFTIEHYVRSTINHVCSTLNNVSSTLNHVRFTMKQYWV